MGWFALATVAAASGPAAVHGGRWLRNGDRIRAEIASVGVLDVSVHEDR